MDSDSNKSLFEPGQAVPKAGIYKVVHLKHRLPHKASFPEGAQFPPCNKCGSHVRFELVFAARPEEQQNSLSAPQRESSKIPS
jgi:hypothetical protein